MVKKDASASLSTGAEADQVRLLRQRHTSRAPGNQMQIAIVTQRVHNSDKVILGNAVGIANFRSGHNPIGVCARGTEGREEHIRRVDLVARGVNRTLRDCRGL